MYGIGRELSFSYLSLAIISHTVILKAYYLNKFQWTVCPHVQKETILRWVNQYFCIYIITSFIFTSYSLSLTIFVLRVTCCSDYVEVIYQILRPKIRLSNVHGFLDLEKFKLQIVFYIENLILFFLGHPVLSHCVIVCTWYAKKYNLLLHYKDKNPIQNILNSDAKSDDGV